MLKFHLERGGVIVSTLHHTHVCTVSTIQHTHVCTITHRTLRFLELWQLQLAMNFTSIILSSFHFFTSSLQVKRSFSYQNTYRLRALRVWSHSSLVSVTTSRCLQTFQRICAGKRHRLQILYLQDQRRPILKQHHLILTKKYWILLASSAKCSISLFWLHQPKAIESTMKSWKSNPSKLINATRCLISRLH